MRSPTVRGGLLSAVVTLMASAAFAAPIIIQVGEGPGTLRLKTISPLGAVDGNDGSFTSATETGNTLWNNCFAIFDGTNGYWVDLGFPEHTDKPVAGVLETEGNAISNKGITFPDTKDLKADLSVRLTRPGPNEALATWKWSFTNSGTTPLPIRMVWFLDADNSLGTAKVGDDAAGLVGKLEKYKIRNPVGAVVLGNFSKAGQIDLRGGIVQDTDRTPAGLYAVSDALGSSYYWTSNKNFTDLGPRENKFTIPAAINWTAGGDTNKDGFSDTANDVGGVIQVSVDVPAGATESVSFFATWGVPETTVPGTFKAPAGS